MHWIAAVAYPLALIFTLIAMLLFLRLLRSRSGAWLIGVYCASLLGVLAHVAAASAVPFCLFIAWSRGQLRFAALRLVPLGLLLTGVVIGLIHYYPDTIQVYHNVQSPDFPQLAEHFLWLWSRLVTTAHWLPVDLWQYHRWELIFGLLGLAGIAVAWAHRVSPVAEWGMWILVMTLPFVNAASRSWQADGSGPSRYLYLASAGSSIVMAWTLCGGRRWLSRHLNPLAAKVTYGIVVAALLLSSFYTLQRVEALSLLNEGKYEILRLNPDVAISLVKRSIEHGEDVIDLESAYVTLIKGHILEGSNAEPVFEKALEDFSRSVELHALWGAFESAASDSEVRERGSERIELAKAYADSSGMRQDFVAAMASSYKVVAKGYQRQGLDVRAVSVLLLLLQYETENAVTYQTLGEFLHVHGDTTLARALLQLAEEADSSSAAAYINRGRTLLKIGAPFPAIAALKRAVVSEPGQAIGWKLLGDAYEKVDELTRSVAAYQRATELSPENEVFRHKLGTVYHRSGRVAEAEESYRAALEQNPRLEQGHYNLGTLYLEQQRFDEALDSYARAIGIDPNFAAAYLHQGVARLSLGKKNELAIESYRRFLELHPEEDDVRRQIQAQLQLLESGDL